MSDLKERKEAFVSGLTGGSISEINQVTSIALIGYFSWCFINKYTNLFHGSNKWSPLSLTIDFLLNWVGLLLAITLYSSQPGMLALGILLPTLSLPLFNRARSTSSQKKTKKINKTEITDKTYLPKKPFVTEYRGGMLVITALAILAVDFKIFPRRFAKVETWGTSLMDLGVGSFVFSMGMVSTRSVMLDEFHQRRVSYWSKLYKSLRSTMTSVALGVLRLIFVKNLDYQEHVTEYGVHWNFFITLVLVGPLTIFIEPIFKFIPRCLVSLIITLTYEWFIVKKEEFLPYLLLAPRVDFLSANREGIFSLLGYWAIFLAGQTSGFYVLPSTAIKNNLYKPSPKQVIINQDKTKFSLFDKLTTVSPLRGLITWCIIYTSLFYFVRQEHAYNVSRRLANLPYVLWVCSYNTGFLVFYTLIDKLFANDNEAYEDRISVSLDSINSNGMILFLLSNVSTGIVNMTINTLDASPAKSIVVLLSYALWIASVGAVLYYKRIFIKL